MFDFLSKFSLLTDIDSSWVAAVATSVAALSAASAVRQARRTNISENRAYLTLARTEVMRTGRARERLSDGSDDAYSIRVWIRNSGKTPATWFKVRYRLCLSVYDADTGTLQDDLVHEGETLTWNGMAGGEEVNFLIQDRPTFEIFARARRLPCDRSAVQLECRIHYGTMFRKRAETWTARTATKTDRFRAYSNERSLADFGGGEVPQPLKMPFSPVEANTTSSKRLPWRLIGKG